MKNDRDMLVEAFDKANHDPIITEDGTVVLLQDGSGIFFMFNDDGRLLHVVTRRLMKGERILLESMR